MSEIDENTSHSYKIYVLGNLWCVRKWQNSISGRDETDIFIYKVPLTLHLLDKIIHNINNAKEPKETDKSMPSKKSLKVSFVTSGPQKSRGSSVFALLQKSCSTIETFKNMAAPPFIELSWKFSSYIFSLIAYYGERCRFKLVLFFLNRLMCSRLL